MYKPEMVKFWPSNAPVKFPPSEPIGEKFAIEEQSFCLYFGSEPHAGGIVGEADLSTVENCHNFGFQYDPSAVVLSCSSFSSSCGGVIGGVCETPVTKCGITRGTLLATAS